MAPKKTVHCLGLDFGTSSAKVSYVSQLDDKLSPPRTFKVGKQACLPAIVLLDQDQAISQICMDSYKGADKPGLVNHQIYRNFKRALLAGDSLAMQAMQAITKKYAHDIQEDDLQGDSFSGDFFKSRMGKSVGNSAEPSADLSTKQAIESSGIAVSAQADEPLAALYYYLFLGQVKFFKEKQSRTLVFDLAGVNSRLTMYDYSQAGIRKLGSETIEWGGDLLDAALVDTWFIAEKCPDLNALDVWRKQILTERMREFKEIFSRNIQKNNTQVAYNFSEFCESSSGKLSKEVFESQQCAGAVIATLKEMLLPVSAKAEFGQVDQIVLAGGSGNWYFVKDIVQQIWPESTVVAVEEAELVISRGLALLAAGYKVQVLEIPAQLLSETATRVEVIDPGPAQPTPAPARPSAEMRKLQRKAAEKMVVPYILWGTLIAGILSPIPGIAPVILIGMEIWMAIQISKIYNQKLEGTTIILTGGMLLAMSIGLKAAVEFVLTIFYILFFLKPLVAGIVIWLIGQASIWFFDKVVYDDLKSLW